MFSGRCRTKIILRWGGGGVDRRAVLFACHRCHATGSDSFTQVHVEEDGNKPPLTLVGATWGRRDRSTRKDEKNKKHTGRLQKNRSASSREGSSNANVWAWGPSQLLLTIPIATRYPVKTTVPAHGPEGADRSAKCSAAALL